MSRRGQTAWLVFIVGGWLVFFALLGAGRLDDLWRWVRDLPLLVELVVWLLAFPWMLGAAVWESSWEAWLRTLVVLALAAGWILVSIPRDRSAAAPASQHGRMSTGA